MAGLLLCSARSEAAIALSKNLAKNLLEMSDVSDVAISGLLIFLGYTIQYIGSAGVFELTHPYGIMSSKLSPAQLTKRRNQVSRTSVGSETVLARATEPLAPPLFFFASH
jgi:hypothetical protein